MEKYYRVLKIRRGATQIEIRNAYRKLAKKLHPDVNDSPTAKDDFIELNEAYEFLTDPEVRKKVRFKATPKARRKTRTQEHQQWSKEKRKKTRENANEHARQRREDYFRRKEADLRKNAPRFIAMFMTMFIILVAMPFFAIIYPKEDRYGITEPINWDAFIFLFTFWGGPISIILFIQIRKEFIILKKKN